jgi:hypothetical protein
MYFSRGTCSCLRLFRLWSLSFGSMRKWKRAWKMMRQTRFLEKSAYWVLGPTFKRRKMGRGPAKSGVSPGFWKGGRFLITVNFKDFFCAHTVIPRVHGNTKHCQARCRFTVQFQIFFTKPKWVISNRIPIGVARICRGGRFCRGGSFYKKFQNFKVNFKDFFPKGVVRPPLPPTPWLRLWYPDPHWPYHMIYVYTCVCECDGNWNLIIGAYVFCRVTCTTTYCSLL